MTDDLYFVSGYHLTGDGAYVSLQPVQLPVNAGAVICQTDEADFFDAMIRAATLYSLGRTGFKELTPAEFAEFSQHFAPAGRRRIISIP